MLKKFAKNSFIYEEVENLKYKETLSGNLVLDLVGDNHYLLSIEENGKSEVLGNFFEYGKAELKFDSAVKYYGDLV